MAVKVREWADRIEEGVKILREQAANPNTIWLGSMIRREMGKDVRDMVEDVRRVEGTARKRDNTWAKTGNKIERRRARWKAMTLAGRDHQQGVRSRWGSSCWPAGEAQRQQRPGGTDDDVLAQRSFI